MAKFDEFKPGPRVLGLKSNHVAEIVYQIEASLTDVLFPAQ